MASEKPDSETRSRTDTDSATPVTADSDDILGSILREFGTGSRDDWAALTASSFAKRGSTDAPPMSTEAVFERLQRITAEGCRLDAVYSAHAAPVEAPGQFPYRRGAASNPATVPRAPWRIAIATPLAAAADTNPLLLDDLHNGATAVHLCCNAAGASLQADTLQLALQGIYLDAIRIDIDAGVQWQRAANAFTDLITSSRSSLDMAALDINLNADPLGAVLQSTDTAALPDDVEDPLIALPDAARGWQQLLSGGGCCCADSRPVHERGATNTVELAYLIASAKSYLDALCSAGFSADNAAAAIRFRVALDQDYFAGIAKLRALRILWANVTAQYQTRADVQCAAISAHTSTRMLSRLDTGNNLLRTTIACAAAALGDADSVTLEPYIIDAGDNAAQVRRSTRNVALVLEHESGLRRVQDPLGGSGFMESLTEQFAATAWQLFQEIESHGGMVAAMRQGWLARVLQQQQQQRRRRIATRELPITGVSEFATSAEDMPAATFGTAVASAPGYLPASRDSEGFEQLRAMVMGLPVQPSVFAVIFGDADACRPRFDFINNLFAAGGIEVIAATDDDTRQQQTYKSRGTPLVVICGTDATYAAEAESLAAQITALRTDGAKRVMLAGKMLPQDQTAAGVDECLYLGCNAIGVLARSLGVLSPDSTTLQAITSDWLSGESV